MILNVRVAKWAHSEVFLVEIQTLFNFKRSRISEIRCGHNFEYCIKKKVRID